MNSSKPLTITEAHAAILGGGLTVRRWVQSCMDVIQRIDGKLKAWVYLNTEQTLRYADELDQKLANGAMPQLLYGAPIGIKDIYNTKNMPTCMGSPIWAGFTPGNDARTVFYVRQAGAVVLGKTATAEFAVHALSETLNPYDFRKTPGTSSSGSAVAVATGMAPIALGTQTAGSVIRPASFCGIYGFKPSFGLIPRTGMLKTTDTLDTVGFFARSPEDLELLFRVLHVKGKDYPLSDAALNDASRQNVNGRPWKVAFVKTRTWDLAEPYAREAMEKFIGQLQEHPGVQVTAENLRGDFDQAHAIHAVIYEKTLAYYFKEEYKKQTLISEILYEMIQRGNEFTLPNYLDALERQKELAQKLESFFNNYDIILTLSTAGQAPDREVMETEDSCLVWTLCGQPVIGIPQFKSPEGLPFGFQAVSRRYNDYLLLKFVKQLRDWGIISNAQTAECRNLSSFEVRASSS